MTLQNGGYAGSPGSTYQDTLGNIYTAITSSDQANNYIASGGQLYWSPTPGNFSPLTTAQYQSGANIPIYILTTPVGSGGGGYGQSSSNHLAPLNAQLIARPRRSSGGGGNGAGAATASAVPAVVNPPAQAAPVQPNVTWEGLNTNVEKGESTI
jgi:hypothetical protein